MSQIELVENLISQRIKEAEEDKIKNTKLYKTLGITVGLGLAIILV